MPSWSLAELLHAPLHSAASQAELSTLLSLEGCLLASVAVEDLCSSARPQGTVFRSASEGGCLDRTATVQGWRVPTSFISWALLETNSAPVLCLVSPLLAGPELLSPIWSSLLETLSPRLLWHSPLTPLLFPWQLWGFPSGTKLLEDFESLSGAAVPCSWLWTSGQPRCCPCPAPGCTLPACSVDVKQLVWWRQLQDLRK